MELAYKPNLASILPRLESLHARAAGDRILATMVHTSIVVKSIAPNTSQCDWMNVFHVVCRCRSGAGSIPWAFKMLPTI